MYVDFYSAPVPVSYRITEKVNAMHDGQQTRKKKGVSGLKGLLETAGFEVTAER